VARGIPREVIEMLRAVPLFSACSTPELRAIAALGSRVIVEPGSLLTIEGRLGSEFFLVMSGTASCRVENKLVATFGPGDYFGELALLSRAPRSATVTADTQMDLLVLSVQEFTSMLDASPRVATKMLGRLADRIRTLESHVSH
jgi:CRP/FNR family transcriptional regulator, cyclic AMP receptor protein